MTEDKAIAERYLAKIRSAEDRGIEFSLSFSDYKRLGKIKRCQYSGIEFCDYENGAPTDSFRMRTLERIDNTKGYIKENVVVICKGINNMKGHWENPNNPLDFKLIERILRNINKRLKVE